MQIDFEGEGYFSNNGEYGGKSAQMRLSFQARVPEKYFAVRILEARGYTEMTSTRNHKDAPCETSIDISSEDARKLAEFLLAVIDA